jgi:DNA-binding winged helix-turn-helix (wHTH) protein/Tol biopolymer transport system component
VTERKCFFFNFADVEVREREFLLIKGGERLSVEPKAFRVLLFLLRNPGRLVSKDEIVASVWNDTVVSDNSLTRSIAQLRRVLDDDPREPRYILTVPTLGYRFLCEVDVREDGFGVGTAATAPPPSEKPSFIETVPKRGYRFIAEVDIDPLTTPDMPNRPILLDRRPMTSGIPQPDWVVHELEEPLGQMQPVPEAAPVQSAPASRKTLRILIAGAVVIAVLAVIWSVRNRPAAPLKFKEQQLTHNSNDNPIISVAVSPDARYFAYSDLSGLHVKLLQTGEIHDLPQPPELGKGRAHWLITWLPDSTRFLAVAFGLGVPLSTWQASVLSGSMRMVRKDAVAWSVSPDGLQFAFTMANEREMWVADIDGNGPRKVADAGAKDWFSNIEWSPDGSHLLYIKRVPTADHLQNSIEIQDVHNGSTTTLISDDSLVSLNWLHDGRILYVKHESGTNGDTCRYWIARLNSAFAKFSTLPQQLTQDNGSCISSISATGDGKRLYFLKQTSEFGIYIADLDPNATRISPPRHFTLTDDREFPAAWTADSRDIVFVSKRKGKWGFYRQSLSSETATPILTGIATSGLGAIFPRVTPDGAWLLYAPYPPDYTPGATIDLMKVPLTGGPPQRVMKAPIYDTPRCSRAPATLCVTAAMDKDELSFTAFDPVHGGRRQLARFKVDDPEKFYTWDLSPDGARIAVLKRGGSEIHILSLRTHEDREFTVKGWSGLEALDWTFDGKGLFISSRAAGSVLLHTDLQGNARVLWEPKGDGMTWAISSPDGHHVALPGFALSSNIWSMEDF